MGSGYSIRAKANNEAEVFLYEDIGQGWFGGVSAKQFADDLKAVGKVNTIHVRINSYGGDVFDGLAIYRQLIDNSAKVVAHIDGVAASIASIIAMAGEEIYISEAGQLMIHNAWGVVMGSSDDMRRMADQLDATSGALADVYVARTKNDIAKVKLWMAEETWFIGKEAVDAGFADTVAENMRIAAHADASKHRFRHMPDIPALAAEPSNIVRPKFDTAKSSLATMSAKMALREAKSPTAQP
jgi:ATP-dependent protease ClpP protease subunit